MVPPPQRKLDERQGEMTPVQPSVASSATASTPPPASSASGERVFTITGIGDHDRPEWLIRINGMRTRLGAGEHQPVARLSGPATAIGGESREPDAIEQLRCRRVGRLSSPPGFSPRKAARRT